MIQWIVFQLFQNFKFLKVARLDTNIWIASPRKRPNLTHSKWTECCKAVKNQLKKSLLVYLKPVLLCQKLKKKDIALAWWEVSNNKSWLQALISSHFRKLCKYAKPLHLIYDIANGLQRANICLCKSLFWTVLFKVLIQIFNEHLH